MISRNLPSRSPEPAPVIPVERVRAGSARDRWVLGAAVAGAIALGSFWFGHQTATPRPAPTVAVAASPAASAAAVAPPAVIAAPISIPQPTPLIRPAAVAPELDSAAASVVSRGDWAVCIAGPAVRCDSALHVELTLPEARDGRKAWPRLLPVAVAPGHLVVAARQTAIAYAVLASADQSSLMTFLDPVATKSGLVFFDIGSDVPAGRYVLVIASAGDPTGLDRFEGAGLQLGP